MRQLCWLPYYRITNMYEVLWKREEKLFKIARPPSRSVSSQISYANTTSGPPHHAQGLIIQTTIQAVVMETGRANLTTLI
ncbi:hypothetical protein CEXT_473861 [Caerostris extrusa]|uniref:Uncharacterized protein n=1 Tax=Caerostris extrusa TaxID=172846 RepID=A0AAV4UMU6_CAEEX|nr:hypothetical protein CEXT_473861 [Caerostris extrusa]